jgi:hypothetical protein
MRLRSALRRKRFTAVVRRLDRDYLHLVTVAA